MQSTGKQNRAVRITASVLGLFGGFLGLEHGVGEMLHGNTPANPGMILAYQAPGLPFPFGGEPALTIIPNYLFTGILAAVFALLLMAWSAWFIWNRYAWLVLYVLAVPLLLFGGGFAPILVLLIAGIAGLKIRSDLGVWRRFPEGLRRLCLHAWPWVLTASFLVSPVAVLCGYLFHVNGNPDPMAFVVPAMICGWIQLALELLSIVCSLGHDSI